MYLLVELGVIIPGLVRGLNVDRVAGDRLRGHDAGESGEVAAKLDNERVTTSASKQILRNNK